MTTISKQSHQQESWRWKESICYQSGLFGRSWSWKDLCIHEYTAHIHSGTDNRQYHSSNLIPGPGIKKYRYDFWLYRFSWLTLIADPSSYSIEEKNSKQKVMLRCWTLVCFLLRQCFLLLSKSNWHSTSKTLFSQGKCTESADSINHTLPRSYHHHHPPTNSLEAGHESTQVSWAEVESCLFTMKVLGLLLTPLLCREMIW